MPNVPKMVRRAIYRPRQSIALEEWSLIQAKDYTNGSL